MTRHGALAAIVALFLILAQVATAAAAPASRGTGGERAGPAAPIDKGLQRELKAGTATTIIVEFDAKANLAPAKKIKDRIKRGNAVVKALQDTAAGSQKTALATVAKTKAAKATSRWLTNVLVVQGDAKTLDKVANELAKLKGVTAVRAPRVYPLVKPVETKVAILAAAGDPEWGVEKIRADEAWVDGVLGQGVVVANVDTGVDYLHPALIEQYRGNNGDGTFTHEFSWFDPTGICGDEPCDNAGHGTHTMGTMVGGDGPGPFTPDVGVAPGARWIAAKGCEDFFCTEESLLASGEFIIAPGGDTSKAPDIVNNSWGSGPGDPFYLETVQAWRAAGIIPVFSSGNPGPFCGEGGSPGDFLESFSVGATDDADLIADFSGRGPSVYGKINPDVAAPGVDVVSSVPGGGYEASSGTSMAAPHVVGTLALMMSAEPALRGDFDAATTALRATAVDRLDDSCGAADDDGDPNNVYGDGRIDAKAAVDLVATGGTLAGTVTDAATNDPIAGVKVTANDGTRQFSAVTDTNGDYDLFLAAGSYVVTTSAFGYAPAGASDVVVVTDQTTDQDFALTALPRFDITGTVRAAEDASPIEGASVLAIGTPVPAAITDATGAYTLTLPIGSYTIRGSAGGCTEVQIHEGVELTDSDITLNFALARKLDDFGHGCHPIALDWVDAPTSTALYGDDWVGRLRLPFDFTFYGATYEQVFLSDNGYVNFLGPDLFNPDPLAIPNEGPPNAAIYALWDDAYLDAGSEISYGTVGAPGDQVFVLEYDNVRVRGATAPLDFEIKLHEDGETVDLLYGNNPANPGDGRGATIGIEDAAGTDALEFSFHEGLLGPNSAYRFEIVPVATIRGTVTDANDGEPIAGASVAASPGLGRATTAADGTYVLRVYPGTYDVTISKSGYVSETTQLVLVDGDDVILNAALDAGIPTVAPTTFEVSLEFGADPVTENVTLGNTGSAPFDWQAKEKGRGTTPVVIPPGTAGKGVMAGKGGTSHTPPRTHAPTRVTPHVVGDLPALILMDILPWDSEALQQVLEANDVAFDVADSSQMSTIDLDGYSFVIIANDQPQAFYDAYVANFDRFSDYVSGGGFLWLEAAYAGFGDGDFGGAPIPGGATVGPVVYDDFNDVAAPDHELMVGVPDPFFGTSASHSVFENVPSDATIIATSSLTGEPTLIEYDFGGGHVVAFAQTLEFAYAFDQDGAKILENAVPYAVNFYRDLSWLSETPATGTLAAGEDTSVAISIGDPNLGPGEYHGQVVFVTTAPKPRQVSVDVTLTIELPESWGGLAGTVTDAHSEEPLGGVAVMVHSQWNGAPFDIPATTAGDGTYSLIGPEGTWPISFSKDGYVSVNTDATIVRGVTTTGVDAALHRNIPHATFEGGPFEFVLTEGRTGHGTVTVANPGGHTDLEIEIGEVDLGGPSSGAAVAGSPTKVTLPAGADPNARTSRGLGAAATPRAVPPRVAAEGDVVASWPTGMTNPWGVGYDGGVWISDFEDVIDVHFSADGVRGDEFDIGGPLAAWGADIAFDTARNLIWQVNVGGDNGIYGLDPADGSVEQVITGSPWDNISQRGLAYDPDADVFYIGGWNEGIIYRVAGPSWPTPGETLNQCEPPDFAISGLAWNRSFGMLWEATNSETNTIWLLDPITCEASVGIPHPDGDFNGAGLELDAVGNLWTVGQFTQNAYLIESGLPNFSDVPWLTVTPTEASIAPDGSLDVDITVDTTGLEPGVYRALAVVLTNDPENTMYQVPVTLVVPTFQQGVDAGGGPEANANGDVFAADRAYGAGPYGYVGASSTRSTIAPIAGTTDDGLYQDLRSGMSSYRFDVPDGTYRVDLLFAELENVKAGGRKFDVSLEGAVVLPGLDVVAAAGGKNTALDRSFVVTVSDGHLDVGFAAQRGDKPIVNAILVTGLPEGAPGT